jgi:isoleucyl-tRNA synthetase
MEINFPKLEEKILNFWKKNKVFQKSIEQRKKAKDFVFYDGPITVNAKPGIHHVLARIFKDVIPRFKTMQGFRVERKNGWDTHGLPVELEVEKNLGFKTKKDIEKYGIAEFNKACKENVQKYIPLFRDLTEKIGYWVDMDNSYITYEADYIETLWWIIKKIWEKGLIYKDYKVVPYCPRCGTSLSSHEVAQGYRKIREPTIFIKFKVKTDNQRWQNTSILSWTTTPWTLPANIALAVNPKMDYIRIPDYEKDGHWLVLGFENLKKLLARGIFDERYKKEKNVDIFKGLELIEIEYEPLFEFSKPEKPAFRVISADFVSTEEGTGVVHIAPAFGEEDMSLIKAQNSKLKAQNEPEFPVLLTVDEEGKFKPEVKQWSGMFVKEADPLIIGELERRNLLFKKEFYEHDYPFCWRCNSALLYYAKESWWIRMTALKKELIKNNEKINWIPAHLKGGRFGEWLREVKDWAISRERYWGTPLPVWKCRNCEKFEVIGSREGLFSQKYSRNRYLILRHGKTLHQTRKGKKIIYDWPSLDSFPLLEKGKKKIRKLVKKLKKEKIDLIYSSDSLRAKQTAEIVAKELSLEIKFDSKLRDINLGVYKDRERKEFRKDFPKTLERFEKKVPGGESWSDVKKRMLDFIKGIDQKHKDKNILIISHGDPLWLLEGAVKGLNNKELLKQNLDKKTIRTGELKEIKVSFLPYDQKGNLDLHRPLIDEVRFNCKKCGGQMEREKYVIDVWFDSGAMPFAQSHWPFEQKKKDKPPKLFPAGYISEAIDQTRGWFYTLLAVSTLLGLESPYKNVICLGHVLDAKGEKMSKSKGNVVDPWQVIAKYGADALRWYFYTVNQPSDSKLFSEKEVEDSLKKFLLTYWNCWLFLETYGKRLKKKKKIQSKNVLDRWIISKLNNLILEVTKALDDYDIVVSTRKIENFVIEDLSQWYIRRSRKRFQPTSYRKSNVEKKDHEEATAALYYIFLTLTQLTAPFIPFLSEEIYQKLLKLVNLSEKKKDFYSVHFEKWPEVKKKLIDNKLEEKMVQVREISSLGLRERARLGIKIRQPLRELAVGKLAEGLEPELINLVKDELNIKSFRSDTELKETIRLDTKITAELREEGILREVTRRIQEIRKELGLKPKDKIIIQLSASEKLIDILNRNKKFILTTTKAKNLKFLEDVREITGTKKETMVDDKKLYLGIEKL